MAMMSNTPRASFGASVFATLWSFVDLLRDWSDATKTANELHQLTDRELDDLGLIRADIEAVAWSLTSKLRH